MELPPSFDDGRPPFDTSIARELLGKYVLVGITVEDKRGVFRRQEQFHGTVVSADPRVGITVALRGRREGETTTLPPDTRPWQPAAKGRYRLRGTGEEVADPDFTATWHLTEPDA